MPDTEPTNLFAPPKAVPPRRVRRSPPGIDALTRIIAVVAGFSLAADPGVIPLVGVVANGVVGGRLLARVIGLLFLVAAFLPWRLNARRDRPTENL